MDQGMKTDLYEFALVTATAAASRAYLSGRSVLSLDSYIGGGADARCMLVGLAAAMNATLAGYLPDFGIVDRYDLAPVTVGALVSAWEAGPADRLPSLEFLISRVGLTRMAVGGVAAWVGMRAAKYVQGMIEGSGKSK